MGTTNGHVHVFTWEGAFIVSMPPLAAAAAETASAPVLHLCVVQGLTSAVLAGDAAGRIRCWDWRSGQTLWVSRPDRPEPIAALLPYPGFGWEGGTVFIATGGGSLIRRDVAANGRASDMVLYGGGTHLHRSKGRRRSEVAVRIRNLCLDISEKMLYCSLQGQTLAFCLSKTKLFARLLAEEGVVSGGSVAGAVAGGDDEAAHQVVSVTVNLQWLVIAYPSVVLVCDRFQFRGRPFCVRHRIPLAIGRVAAVATLSHYVVVFNQPASAAAAVTDPSNAAAVTKAAGTLPSGGNIAGLGTEPLAAAAGDPSMMAHANVFDADSWRLRDVCALPMPSG